MSEDLFLSMVDRTPGRRDTDHPGHPLTSAEQARRLNEFSEATGIDMLTAFGLEWIAYLTGDDHIRPTGVAPLRPWLPVFHLADGVNVVQRDGVYRVHCSRLGLSVQSDVSKAALELAYHRGDVTFPALAVTA